MTEKSLYCSEPWLSSGHPGRLAQNLQRSKMDCFFYSYPAASDLLFLPTSTPQHQLFFGEFDWALEKKKRKGLYLEPPDKFGRKYNFGGARGFESPPIRASPPADCRRYFRYPSLSSSAPNRAALCGLRRRVVLDRAFS